MMISSKKLAIKSCKKKSSHHRLHNQMHKVLVALNSKYKSQKKRKFVRYICNDIFTTSFKHLGRDKYGSEKGKDQGRCLSSPFLCSTLVDKKHIILQGTKKLIVPNLDDKGEYCDICMEDCSYLSGSNDSIKGSSYPMNQRSLEIQPRDKQIILQGAEEQIFPTLDDKGGYSHQSESKDSIKGPSCPMYQGSLKTQARDLMGSSNFSLPTKTSLNDKPKIDFGEASKSMVDGDFTDGKSLLSLSSTEQDMELVRSLNNFLPARGNHLPRPVIPIGPRFQATIPKWEGVTDIKQFSDDDDLKWLGTQIWPIPFISETNIKGLKSV